MKDKWDGRETGRRNGSRGNEARTKEEGAPRGRMKEEGGVKGGGDVTQLFKEGRCSAWTGLIDQTQRSIASGWR